MKDDKTKPQIKSVISTNDQWAVNDFKKNPARWDKGYIVRNDQNNPDEDCDPWLEYHTEKEINLSVGDLITKRELGVQEIITVWYDINEGYYIYDTKNH